MLKEVTRNIKVPVQNMLWGKAGGRCEFSGCNKPLWKSSVTQEQVNIAQKAHIYSFSDVGPRGNDEIEKDELNELGNLMLVCHECHQKMDKEKNGGRYTSQLLRGWKATHEARIELVTGIEPSKRSHVLLYGANIGDYSSPLRFDSTAPVLFPERYPAAANAIELGMVNSAWTDKNADFWNVEAGNLVRQFQEKVADRLADGTIGHLSIFGLAPQPLLMLLGSLLTDIPPANVYQLRREPQGWAWSETHDGADFVVKTPENGSGEPALVLSLSATIARDRITSVLGAHVPIWEVTIKNPANDFLQTPDQLRQFRQRVRALLDQIKAAHGRDATLHVFPALPVAAAIEVGRVHMPKADLKLRVYDEIRHAGFVPALSIPGGSTSDDN